MWGICEKVGPQALFLNTSDRDNALGEIIKNLRGSIGLLSKHILHRRSFGHETPDFDTLY